MGFDSFYAAPPGAAGALAEATRREPPADAARMRLSLEDLQAAPSFRGRSKSNWGGGRGTMANVKSVIFGVKYADRRIQALDKVVQGWGKAMARYCKSHKDYE
jgi:hypothetical protein